MSLAESLLEADDSRSARLLTWKQLEQLTGEDTMNLLPKIGIKLGMGGYGGNEVMLRMYKKTLSAYDMGWLATHQVRFALVGPYDIGPAFFTITLGDLLARMGIEPQAAPPPRRKTRKTGDPATDPDLPAYLTGSRCPAIVTSLASF